MYSKQINILHLEDNLADVELIAIELHQHCELCKIKHVKNEQEFIAALAEGNFDLVLSDFNVLGFQGLEIYRTFKKAKLDVPFIFVSGTIGEEKAVDVLREGVTDYVTKQNLGKLHIAISRAIKEYYSRKKLSEQEKFLASTLNSLSGHIAVVKKDGEIIATNDAWEEFAEKNKGASSIKNVGVGANYIEVVKSAANNDKTIDEIYRGILKVITRELDYFYKDYSCHSPTEKRWYTLRVTPLKDSDNIIISHANITNRVLAQQETKQIKDKLELIANNIGEIVYKLSYDGNNQHIDYISNNVIEVIGFTTEDYLAGNPKLKESMKPERFAKAQKFYKTVRNTVEAKNFTFEYEWYHPIKKEWIWLEETLVPEIKNGKAVGQFGKVIDITYKKEQAAALRQNELKYKGLFSKMKEGLIYSTPDGIIQIVNPSFCNLLGYNQNELLGVNGYKLLLPNKKEEERLKDKVKQRVEGKSENYESVMLTKSGQEIIVNISASPQFDDKDKFVGVMSIITDITEQKLQQEELQKSEQKLKDLFDNVTDAIVVLNEKGRIEEYNKAFNTLFNETNQTLYNLSIPELVTIHEDDIEKSINYYKLLKSEGKQSYQGRVYTKSGKLIWIEVNSVAIFNDEGECVGSRDVIRDITTKKKAEQEKELYIQTQKVINRLLELSHTPISLNELLNIAIELIVSLPFIQLLPKGVIFLSDKNNNLNLIAHHKLPKELQITCAFVEKGKCMCGKAAETKEMVFSNCLDNNHQITYKGITPHGHYAVPIKEHNKLLGVLNVYLQEKHVKKDNEIKTLESITNTLAIIIRNKRIEERNRKSEERLKEAQKIAKMGNWELNLKTNNLYWSDQNYTVFGVNNKEDFGGNYEYFLSLIHPDDKEKVNKAYMNHVNNKKPYEIDHRIVLPNGEIRYIHEKCESVFDKSGKAIISRGTSQDITASKVTDNIFEAIFNTTSTHGGAKYFTEITNLLCEVLNVKYAFIGYKIEGEEKIQTLGVSKDAKTVSNYIYGLKDTPCWLVLDEQVQVYPNNIQGLFPKAKDLKDLKAESFMGLSLISNNQTIGIIVLIDDKPMTEIEFKKIILDNIKSRTETEINRVKFEEALISTKERFKGLVEYSSEITCILDELGIIKFITPSVTTILGYVEKEMIGKKVIDYIHPDDWKKAENITKINKQKKQNLNHDVYKVRTKKGDIRHLRMTITNHFDKPAINGFVINAQDVTHLINTEKEKYQTILNTEQTERRRIAHDLHDGLGQTIAAANMCMDVLDDFAKEQFDEEVYDIFKTGKKLISDATKETRLVSHNIMPRSLKQYGLEDASRTMIENYKRINKEIDFEFESNMNAIRFNDEVELTIYRVLQEAINNAVKYSKAQNISVRLNVLGKRLFIYIDDNGVGFDVEDAKSRKSGLGLTSLAERVNIIGGSFDIKSELGKGTSITVTYRFGAD